MKTQKPYSEAGFSVAELIVVLALSAIMTTVSLYYLYSHQKLYKPDEQAALLIDMLQEARQRALTEKVTMRVEMDLTDNVARLINEGDATISTDDKVVRIFSLKAVQEVNIEKRPNNVNVSPTEPSPVNAVTFAANSTHPLSLNHKVATLRFRKDGTVYNAGTNALGAGAEMTGATIFLWQPDKSNANNSTITRAITIIGTSGAIRLWNYYPGLAANVSWKDSRRFQ
jgi:Tfp pilus assembly protein FimT